jgi:hypothetical protein
MAPFTTEQKKSLDARLRKLLVRLTIGYVLLAAGLAFSGYELANVIHKVDTSSKNQLINRASNVATWCESINEGRERIRPILSIKYLPCRALVRETYHSGSVSKDENLQSLEARLKH